jgi:hypothetical protein
VDVAELVPEVAVGQGRLIAVAEQVFSMEGREHPQVRGTRLMEPGEQAVHHPQARLRGDHVGGPAGLGRDGDGCQGGGFQGADDGRTDRDHPAA